MIGLDILLIKIEKMDCKFANEISIAGFLTSRGINPNKTIGNCFWYCSPIRNEHTPSFKVNRDKNLWYDFGTATGGSLIDLVCQMYHVGVPGALLILSGVTVADRISFIDQRVDVTPPVRIEIKHVQPLKNRALFQYLILRRINPLFASRYAVEATYQVGAKEWNNFAIGFKNDCGGYELRNRIAKLSTSPKDITTIEGKNRSALNVFEGFMDFLSALTYFKTDRSGCDTIVLNGAGFVKRILDRLPGYHTINLFLDNDKAGLEAAAQIQLIRPDTINRSQNIYPDCKDFNDFLKKR